MIVIEEDTERENGRARGKGRVRWLDRTLCLMRSCQMFYALSSPKLKWVIIALMGAFNDVSHGPNNVPASYEGL